MRWSLALLALLLLAGARAARVEVLQADRLELRKVEGHELVVLYGRPVKIRLADGQEIEADVVEYDRDARRLLLAGNVLYGDKEGRIIESKQLELYLDDESMDAIEVHLRSGGVDFWGPEATRVLGQILMQDGRFTPCARCGQDPYDYAFSARKVVLYPGDRLIAYGVTLYVQGQAYLTWPILMLHFSNRRPKLEVRHDPVDGWSLAADLPYVTDGGLGFTLLRYFQNRGWGFGVDHWGIGPAYEHYRALYLPPEVGADKGSLQLDLTYREGDERLRDLPYYANFHLKYDDAWPLPEQPHWSITGEWRQKGKDGWRRSFSLSRRDLPDQNRLWLNAYVRRESGPDPKPSLRLKTYFDLGEPGPPAAMTIPEVTLKWVKGWKYAGFSIKGSVSAGGYYDRTNELNRSARAAGVWAGAGRVFVKHADVYDAKQPWPGFNLHFENRFSGWYYDTGERQVDWRNALSLEQKLGALRFKTAVRRTVVEGEAFFARDYRRPVHTLVLDAQAGWRPTKELNLSAKGGWDVWQGEYKKLTASLSWTPRPFNLSLKHVYDPQTGLNQSSTGSIGYKAGNFSASLSSGYDYQKGNYAPLAFKGSYALPGGNALFNHVYDLDTGRSQSTKFSISLQPGQNRYSLSESYSYENERLTGSLTTSWGPFSLKLSHDTFLVSDPADPNFRHSKLSLAASWREHKLLLEENWNGRLGRFGPGHFSVSSRYTGVNRTWSLKARWHLPEEGDEAVYLETASVSGGLDVLAPTTEHPGFSLQGGFEYVRYGPDDRQLKFKNFGFTAAWVADEHTRVFVTTLVNQEVRTSEGWPPLEPRFIFTLDRCCWAFQFTIDAAVPSAKLSFMYGGKSAGFLFGESGIHYPWEDAP
ncbi:hypothetical protein [Oceanithermus sp.]